MKVSQLLQYRLTDQQIVEHRYSNPHDLVAHLGAVQAQDLTSALWSIGLRLPGSTAASVLQAIADKQLVWTWTMRGTLHIVAAEDVRWMLELLAPRAVARAKSVYRQVGLQEDMFQRAAAILEHGLRGGKQFTRKQAMELWEEAGIGTTNQRGYLMLARLAQEARICLGPPSDKTQTFVLLEEWLPESKSLDHDTALAEVALRYFTSHGPATLDDFVWWTGLTRTDARRALDAVMPTLTTATVADKTYFYKPTANQLSGSSVRLLPGFDEYMLGYTDRSLVLQDMHRHHVYTKNAVYPGTIVIEGQVEGTWKRVIAGQRMRCMLSLFREVTTSERSEIEKWCKQYGEFWGKETVVEFSV